MRLIGVCIGDPLADHRNLKETVMQARGREGHEDQKAHSVRALVRTVTVGGSGRRWSSDSRSIVMDVSMAWEATR
jgi:hypothetical protein